MHSVKIAIDIRRMTEFGVGTYIRNVVRSLGRIDHENAYFLIGPPAKVQEIGPLPPNFQTVPLLTPERSTRGYREFRGRTQGARLRSGAYSQFVFRAADVALSVCHDRP